MLLIILSLIITASLTAYGITLLIDKSYDLYYKYRLKKKSKKFVDSLTDQEVIDLRDLLKKYKE